MSIIHTANTSCVKVLTLSIIHTANTSSVRESNIIHTANISPVRVWHYIIYTAKVLPVRVWHCPSFTQQTFHLWESDIVDHPHSNYFTSKSLTLSSIYRLITFSVKCLLTVTWQILHITIVSIWCSQSLIGWYSVNFLAHIQYAFNY